MKFVLLAVSLCCFSSVFASTHLKKTNLDFLDDLSATESSAASTSSFDFNRNKKSRITLPPIRELEEEESVDLDSIQVKVESKAPKSQNTQKTQNSHSSNSHSASNSILARGPSEEDRIIDDKLKFLLPYYDIYEQIDGPSSPIKHFLFILILTAFLVLLFYLMYSISSDYLTPSLAHLSSACRMSPDMAGLTFLAFGNGAPDLFTALLGAEDAPEMILGSSIGSGLFIFTVVFGLVIIFARDPALPQSSSSTAIILSFPSPKDSSSRVKIGRGTFWRNALMYGGCVAALAVFVVSRRIPMWQPFVLIVIFFVYLIASISAHYFLKSPKKQQQQEKQTDEENNNNISNNIHGEIHNSSEDPINGSMQLLEIERRRYKLQQLSLFEQFKFSFTEVTEWREMGLLGKSFWILTSPLRLILNLTILPLPDPTMIESSPDRLLAHWFLSRFLITINPFGSVALLAWLTGTAETILNRPNGVAWLVFIYCILTALLVLMFHLGSSAISNPLAGSDRNWRTSLPLWLATIYSFTCCIAWIFAVSNELVAALSSLGLILGVSRTIMGCLVLAWGNSIGDLIADVALARNGAPQTAITAIFSGPVQNVLLTIGISFMAAAAQSPHHTIKLSQLRGDVHLSLVLLAIVICACLVLIPGYFKYRIPRQFGVALVLLYVIYVPFSIWLGINQGV